MAYTVIYPGKYLEDVVATFHIAVFEFAKEHAVLLGDTRGVSKSSLIAEKRLEAHIPRRWYSC